MQKDSLNCPKHFLSVITSEKGIALLMVLWVLVVLMVIILSFSFMTRIEAQSTMAFKEGIEKKFIAEAGLQRAVAEMLYRMSIGPALVPEGLVEDSAVWKTDGTLYKGDFGGGYYTVRIMDESGKLNINTASEVVLKNFLVYMGIQGDEADTIVDSIMDWKDPDDLHRLHGAESDYYLSLPNPYKARNANFETLEELLLVKGITPEILYGNAQRKGIIDFLTVYSNTSAVNVNAASKDALMAVPGMTTAFADAILAFRETAEIRNLQDIQPILGESFAIISPHMNAAGSTTFSIVASGYKGTEKGGFSVRATLAIGGNKNYRYLYYKSPA